ncbi:unnamed protein product [Effrenium voratum]|nr:unnamed protein product [Effrenium voratum]
MSLKLTRGAWASALACVSEAPEALEGIFFGFPGGPCISFRLLGCAGAGVDATETRLSAAAKALVAEKKALGERPMAWASLQRSKQAKESVRRLHEAFSKELQGSEEVAVGCLIICPRGQQAQLVQHAVAVAGPDLQPIQLLLAADPPKPKQQAPGLPAGGKLQEALKRCEPGLRKAGDLLEQAVTDALEELQGSPRGVKRFFQERAAAGKFARTNDAEKAPGEKRHYERMLAEPPTPLRPGLGEMSRARDETQCAATSA